jgi:CBS domain containing-hemolysin-like protein
VSTLELILLIALFGIALFGVAIFAGIEVGLYSVNRVRLDVRANRQPPDPRAIMVRKELERPDRMIAAIMAGMNISHNVSSVVSAELLARTEYGEGAQVVINVLVLTPILIIFGEALPKELFRAEADRLTYTFVPVLRVVRVGLTWTGIIPLVSQFGRLVEKIAGLKSEHASDSRQRMALLFREGASQGTISESQGDLIERALTLRRVTVADEMIPWASARTIPADVTRDAALRVIAGSLHTEYPALDRRGNLVGIIRHIDLYLKPTASPRDLLKSSIELPSSMPVREALAALRMVGSRIAVVRDTWGKPVGVVTVKDLIEPLTGEISDL